MMSDAHRHVHAILKQQQQNSYNEYTFPRNEDIAEIWMKIACVAVAYWYSAWISFD